jgi:hypothetical protein
MMALYYGPNALPTDERKNPRDEQGAAQEFFPNRQIIKKIHFL